LSKFAKGERKKIDCQQHGRKMTLGPRESGETHSKQNKSLLERGFASSGHISEVITFSRNTYTT